MKLHAQKSSKSRVSRRVGRGGKRGTTAGRGTKGQHSRAGRVLRPAIRDLIIRLPKLRGFRNKVKSDKPIVFNLSRLSEALKTHAKGGSLEITRELLQSAKLLSKNYTGKIKILGTGEAAFPMTFTEIAVSKSVAEKAGGKK